MISHIILYSMVIIKTKNLSGRLFIGSYRSYLTKEREMSFQWGPKFECTVRTTTLFSTDDYVDDLLNHAARQKANYPGKEAN